MTSHRLTFVNHASVQIDCPAETLWDVLIADYGSGNGFARVGYRVEPLDDPALDLGGYRITFEKDDFVDERICRITERDDSAMRLSLHADYLSPQGMGLTVYATYQALPADNGCLYRLDCHSTLDHEIEDGASRETIAAGIAARRLAFEQSMPATVERMKTHIEAAQSA